MASQKSHGVARLLLKGAVLLTHVYVESRLTDQIELPGVRGSPLRKTTIGFSPQVTIRCSTSVVEDPTRDTHPGIKNLPTNS